MKEYIKIDPWKVVEEGFHSDYSQVSESIFSIGNGRMGQRANFEEKYHGKTLRGSYLAGVYYPDKTRVGWWKNGYPDYFAKVLNSVSWNQIDIFINGESIDLHQLEAQDFVRVLDMKTGLLTRKFRVTTSQGIELELEWNRFISMHRKNIGVISLKLRASHSCEVRIKSWVCGDVRNQDSNYDEIFWENTTAGSDDHGVWVKQTTKKTNFSVFANALHNIYIDHHNYTSTFNKETLSGSLEYIIKLEARKGFTFEKYTAVCTSRYENEANLQEQASKESLEARQAGWDVLFAEQRNAWAEIWKNSDIEIEGDASAQQAIRFNIFQLFQTYTGDDARLNIGPKGFTGEKYGGSTYWDTEAYCLPFYLTSAPTEVAKNLLLYRYHHLDKAIENAKKLGFDRGAALYPMVTMNGEECHNEWEITFEEIHRNGAIAYAIYDYINYTGDESYMWDFGLEVLTGIARFWSQRVHFSTDKNAFVMLGVTGPNEFENNVNNNWYTNKLAVWCLDYARNNWNRLAQFNMELYQELATKLILDPQEFDRWKLISEKMYFPYDERRNMYLQQDGFLDKELIPVAELPSNQRPIVEHWSWDRILRSCYIKQADVLQGFYFFEDEFDIESHKRHFHFYEPLTVHESSLSPCIHSILANKIGDLEKAYEFYLRTARLDLNDINNDTCDGCHITSMAGTWMTISKGFAGMRVKNGSIHLSPSLPSQWSAIKFPIRFRSNYLRITLERNRLNIQNMEGGDITVYCFNKDIPVASGESQTFYYES